jgi:hypothetical protein
MSPIVIVGGAVTIFFILFFVVPFGLRQICDYRIRNNSIEIIVFRGLPVWRIPFDNIESVDVKSWKDLSLNPSTIRLGNRLAGRYLLIEKKRGLFRYVAITPGNAEEFASKIPVNRGVPEKN